MTLIMDEVDDEIEAMMGDIRTQYEKRQAKKKQREKRATRSKTIRESAKTKWAGRSPATKRNGI